VNTLSLSKIQTNVLEIDLPKDFCLENNKEVLFKIFSDNLKTGGDKILEDRSIYKRDSQKAFIYYEKEEVADRVASNTAILFGKYLFKVRLVFGPVPETPEENVIKIIRLISLKKDEKLTIDKINNQLKFLKDHIIGIEIESNSNCAILKLNSAQGKLFIFEKFKFHLISLVAGRISILKFENFRTEMVDDATNRINNIETLHKDFTRSPEAIEKPFKNNLFLELTLENLKWRNKLKREISFSYGNLNVNKSGLKIDCTIKSDSKDYEEVVKSWTKNINSKITFFLKDFSIECLSLLDYDLNSVLDGIKELNRKNKNFVQVRVAENENKLHFVVARKNFQQFQRFLENLLIEKKTSLEFQVPLLASPEFYEIINPLLNNLKPKFPDIQQIYNALLKKILLSGFKKRVDDFYMLLQEYFSGISCEKLRSINEDALNCPNVIILLEKFTDEKQMLCKFMKKHDGFYLIFFQNKKHETFDQLETIIVQNYSSTKIDYHNLTDVLNGQKWFLFKKDNLIGNQNITFYVDKNITIFGKKEDVNMLESKINEFLEANIKKDGIKFDFSKDIV
jgi:hypothetical protein